MNSNFIIEEGFILKSYNGEDKHIVIPHGVRIISHSAFIGNKNIVSVDFPETVLHVGMQAFRGCTNLKDVHFSGRLIEIAASAFYGCTSLKELVIPDTGSIANEAFRNCTGLKYVTIFDGCKEIGVSAFEGCASLERVALPDSIEQIGHDAFKNCVNLINVVTEENLNEIFDDCFQGCDALKEELGNREKIVNMLIDNTIAIAYNDTLVSFNDSVSDEFTIPDNITCISNTAFKNCTKLRSLTILESVDEIEPGAFDDCINLEEINLPDGYELVEVDDLVNTKWYRDSKKGFRILGGTLIEYNGDEDEITVPAYVKRIAKGAFSNIRRYVIINLPSTIKKIYAEAFNPNWYPTLSIYEV